MKKLDAYKTFLFLSGADGAIAWTIFTASAIYQVTVVGLNPLQLVLVGTTLEATAFLFEIPTGVVADVYSRRLSIIIGYVLIGIGFLVEGLFPFFSMVLLAQVLWGIGYTFTSGATQAWLTDEVGEARAGPAFMRAAQIAQLATLIGIVVGTLSGNVQIQLPIVIGGFGFIVLGIFLALWMPEVGFHPTPREERGSFHAMWRTFRDGLAMVQRRPMLSTILWIGLFYGLYSEGVDRLWTPFLLTFTFPIFDGLTTVTWFGIIRFGAIVLSVIATEFVRQRVDMQHEPSMRRVLFTVSALMVVSLAMFALSFNFVMAVLAYWVFTLLRQTTGPLYTTWVNQRLDSKVRATVNSMSAQVDELGQLTGGPFIGAIGTLISIRAALLASTVILSPVLALLACAARQKSDASEVEAVSGKEAVPEW